jgi:hypothetical protein
MSPRIVSNRFFLALKNLTASVHSALLTAKNEACYSDSDLIEPAARKEARW